MSVSVLTTWNKIYSRKKKKTIEWHILESSDGESDERNDSDSSDDDATSAFRDSARPRHESAEGKKLRKQAVKDAKAEKRKTKLKKHVKKRKEKQGIKKK